MKTFKLEKTDLDFYDAIKLLGNYANKEAFIKCADSDHALFFDDNEELTAFNTADDDFSDYLSSLSRDELTTFSDWQLYINISNADDCISCIALDD